LNSIVKVETQQVVSVNVDWELLACRVADLIAYDLKNTMFEACQEKIAVDNIGMLAMYADDAGNGLDVCKMLATGNWDKVKDMLWSMDTAPRDCVSGYIGDVGGEEFRKHYMD
jgi:hypothetical protein